jgi:hypothetical protein
VAEVPRATCTDATIRHHAGRHDRRIDARECGKMRPNIFCHERSSTTVNAEGRVPKVERIVCFQGRAGERAVGNIPGAIAVAQAMSVEWNRPVSIIGTPSNPRKDSYADALSEARIALDELYRSVTAQRRAGLLPVCVLPTDGAAPAVLFGSDQR